MTRRSAADRARSSLRAEREIQRFAQPDAETGYPPFALWHQHVHGVRLDPMQVLRMHDMWDHRQTVDFSCRRTRKTSTKELYNLFRLATEAHLECGIVAPRQQQSQNNLNYMLESVKRSPMLEAFIGWDRGRKRLTDTGFAFANGSRASCYGIMGQIDGDSLAIASLEEVDDMPQDRLLSRFLPMLGAAQRLGVDKKINPEIRISGVFKGADTLQRLLDTGEYHRLPTVDVYLGVEMGIVSEAWADSMRAQQTEEEWLRQFLCMNIAARNWIWEKHIRRALQVGLMAGLERADPLPGVRHRKRGLIAFGYDHSGHGESATASKSALVVAEQLGNYVTFPFVRAWPAGTDDRVVERDLYGLWDFFRPDYAMGDAYGVGMMSSLNDRLYAGGLTEIDRRAIGDGQSTASTWTGWAFAPIRFQGMTKHSMASVLKAAFHNGQAAIPYVDTDDDAEPEEWRAFVRQLGNIKAEATQADYSSFKMADTKLGDDFFDAACAAVWALTTRGAEDVPAVIAHRTQTREQLLGVAA